MSHQFGGTAWALSHQGLTNVASDLGISAAEIWTVLAVETAGYGYLPDRRPRILYERHFFHRLTKGKFSGDADNHDISHSQPGGYGAGGAPQYQRLHRAIALHRSAALRSASWGLGQVMGDHYAVVGFLSEEYMVEAMSRSEDEQLTAMGRFIASKKTLHHALQTHDWETVAKLYNGPNYKINKYDVQLEAQYKKYSGSKLPDLDIRATQLYLTYLGFKPGAIDGIVGRATLAAWAEFQKRSGLAIGRAIDKDAVAQLRAALSPVG